MIFALFLEIEGNWTYCLIGGLVYVDEETVLVLYSLKSNTTHNKYFAKVSCSA